MFTSIFSLKFWIDGVYRPNDIEVGKFCSFSSVLTENVIKCDSDRNGDMKIVVQIEWYNAFLN